MIFLIANSPIKTIELLLKYIESVENINFFPMSEKRNLIPSFKPRFYHILKILSLFKAIG